MKIIAQLIALGLPDANPAQINAALCLATTLMKAQVEKLRQQSF